jgi:hypothetical protein
MYLAYKENVDSLMTFSFCSLDIYLRTLNRLNEKGANDRRLGWAARGPLPGAPLLAGLPVPSAWRGAEGPPARVLERGLVPDRRAPEPGRRRRPLGPKKKEKIKRVKKERET